MFFATGKSTICAPDATGSRSLRVTNSINAGISSMTTSCGLFPASPMMMATSVAWPLPVSDNDPYRSTTIWLVAVNKPLLSSRSIKLFRHSLAPRYANWRTNPNFENIECTNHIHTLGLPFSEVERNDLTTVPLTRFYALRTAIASISSFTSFGKRATCTQLRVG